MFFLEKLLVKSSQLPVLPEALLCSSLNWDVHCGPQFQVTFSIYINQKNNVILDKRIRKTDMKCNIFRRPILHSTT
jgi:hypothetical protein